MKQVMRRMFHRHLSQAFEVWAGKKDEVAENKLKAWLCKLQPVEPVLSAPASST